MKNAIVASKNEQSSDVITSLLSECGFDSIKAVSSGIEMREAFILYKFELAVIFTPLQDEVGIDLAKDIMDSYDSALIMISNSDNAERIQKTIASPNIFILPRPINKNNFSQTVRHLLIARAQILKLKSENNMLQKKVNDIKIINRAKCLLIQNLRLTEEQAHKHIQKQSMNLRISEIDVSKDILKTYEF